MQKDFLCTWTEKLSGESTDGYFPIMVQVTYVLYGLSGCLVLGASGGRQTHDLRSR